MALSVPVNGLKEGDKEPVIELFVKVRRGGGSRLPRAPTVGRPPPAAVFPPVPASGPGWGTGELQVFLGGSARGPAPAERGGAGVGVALPAGRRGSPRRAGRGPPLPAPRRFPRPAPAPQTRRGRGRGRGGAAGAPSSLLRAAPGPGCRRRPVARRGAARGAQKGPSAGRGGRAGRGAESVCADGAGDSANRQEVTSEDVVRRLLENSWPRVNGAAGAQRERRGVTRCGHRHAAPGPRRW